MNIKKQDIIYYSGSLMRVQSVEFYRTGKNNVVYRVMLKDLLKNTSQLVNIKEREKIRYAIDVLEISSMFSYRERNFLIFLGEENQFEVDVKNVKPEQLTLLLHAVEDVYCKLLIRKSKVLKLTLPPALQIQVERTAAIARSLGASSMTKRPITLAGGLEAFAPHFIKSGDVVTVNTKTLEYVSRN